MSLCPFLLIFVAVTITVDAVNDPPVANDDAVTTSEESTVTINVLDGTAGGADLDVDNDTLTTALVGNAGNGVVTLNSDGTFDYTPDPNFFGQDSFVYRISDGNGETDTATVTIFVSSAGNNPPTAIDDSVTTNEDVAIVIDVLIDNGPGSETDSDPDSGDSLTPVAGTDPANGGAVLNPDGTFTYTPDPDFVGQDSFVYTLSDGNGGTDTATGTFE